MDGQARIAVYLELKNKLKSGLDQAKQYLNKNVQDMKGKLNELKNSHIQSFKAMQDQVPGFGNAMSLLGNPYALLTVGLLALGGAMAKASSIASDFDKAMAKANTTAQETPIQLKKTKDELGAIAAKSGLENAHQNAVRAYDVMLSSGLDRDTSIKSVPAILKASKATGTDSETVSRATSGVMNSTGITDSNVVLDKMAMVKNKGNAEFADIANYLPKIIPAANNAGIAIDDVGGAFAYLTAMGLKSEQAATGLENAFKTLADPSKAAAFEKIGVNFYDAQGKMRPLLDTTKDLKTALTGLTDQQKSTVLSSLGLDMESASAFAIMTKDVTKLEGAITGVANATGELDRQAKAAETPMDSWVRLANSVHEAFRLVGDKINAILGPIGTFLANSFQSLLEGSSSFTPILDGISSIFTGIWNAVSGIAMGIWQVLEPLFIWIQNSNFLQFLFWGISKIAEFIGFLVGKIGDLFSGIGSIIRTVYDNTLKPFVDTLEWIWGRINKLLGIDTKNSQVNKAKEALGDTGAAKTETPVKEAKDLLGKPSDKVQKVLAEEKDKADKKASKETGMSGGSQTKVITINKVSMIDGNFVSSNAEFAGMDKAAMEKFLQELFQRMMINLGRSYS